MSDSPEVLREYRVTLSPSTESVEMSNGGRHLGGKTKFGGVPDPIQKNSPYKIACHTCGQPMRFIAQIDSFEHKSKENPNAKEYNEQHFMFGDVGMIYVWFCFDCLTPVARMDCH